MSSTTAPERPPSARNAPEPPAGRVRDQAREAVLLIGFSALTSAALAGAFRLLPHLGLG